MKEERKQIPLRLSASVYDGIAKWAADDFRSVNAQIEYLLAESLRRRKRIAEEKRKEKDS